TSRTASRRAWTDRMAKIALDKTRPFATVHGDTGSLNICFEQDTLPFDAAGNLIEKALNADQRKMLEKRLARQAAAPKKPAAADAEQDAGVDDDESPAGQDIGGDADINLE